MQAILGFVATPFGYVMRFIYEFIGSYGWSIVLFALLAKLLTMPLTLKQKRGMLEMQRIQPKVQEIQKKYGRDKARMNQEIQELYANEGVSPMAGCGSTLITLPIMMGLYYVISQPLLYFMQLTTEEISAIADRLGYEMGNLFTGQSGLVGAIYDNFSAVEGMSDKLMAVDMNFGPINMALTPSFKEFGWLWLIPILSGLTALGFSFVSQKLQEKNGMMTNPQASQSSKMMLMMMPLMSVYFGFILPAGLGVYWIASNIFMALTEVIMYYWMHRRLPDAGKE